jgi:zinc/manganese transport system substrate-binding protein
MFGGRAWTFALVALATIGAGNSPLAAAEPLKVVASFSILGDLVAEVGREHVNVRTLVGPNGDAHVYEPSPADARDTAAAGLVVVNGLGLEGWFNRLVDASGYSGPVAVASEGVTPLHLDEEEAAGMPVEAAETGEGEHDHGAIDPHAWQSIANAEIYVRNIASALCGADRANCAGYQANAAAYTAELKALEASIKDSFAALPAEKRKVITTHDAFGYFAHAYGVTFLAPVGISTEAEASAADVAGLINQIRGEGVTAIFFENISDPRLIEQIASETGIHPGGELYSDALSPADGPAATYIDMMRHNARLLESAMLGT